MYFDAKNMFAKDLAHNGTAEVVDLYHSKMGPGTRLKIEIIGNGLAGATGVVLTDGATSAAADDLVEFTFTAAELNDGVTVSVPETVNRYLTLDLVGTTTAGTYNAGIVLEEGQTNR